MEKRRKKEKKKGGEVAYVPCTYVYTPPANMREERIGGTHGI